MWFLLHHQCLTQAPKSANLCDSSGQFYIYQIEHFPMDKQSGATTRFLQRKCFPIMTALGNELKWPKFSICLWEEGLSTKILLNNNGICVKHYTLWTCLESGSPFSPPTNNNSTLFNIILPTGNFWHEIYYRLALWGQASLLMSPLKGWSIH